MKTIKKKLVVNSKKEFYLKHLHIITPFLPIDLTNKEIEVLASFMSLDMDNKFNTEGRRLVKELIPNLSDGGLGNYLRDLKKKGIILSDKSGNLYIHTVLLPTDTESQEYTFNVVLSVE